MWRKELCAKKMESAPLLLLLLIAVEKHGKHKKLAKLEGLHIYLVTIVLLINHKL